MTFDEYAEKHLSALTPEGRRLVQMGWNGHEEFGGDQAARAQGGNSVAIPRDVAQAKGMYLVGYSWLKHNAPQELATPQPADSFQSRVAPWMQECFGREISSDSVERNHRFLEESLELVQSLGCTKGEALQLVDYVYGREVGDPPQEVGGVMVTLAALCLASNLNMHECGETELARITQPEIVEKIREKQKRKPSMSPLPGVYPDRPTLPEQESE